MKSKRIVVSLPTEIGADLTRYAATQGVTRSFVVQMAVTKLGGTTPDPKEVTTTRGHSTQVQVTLSETAFRLLELWSKQTGLSKTKLITYALEQTIEREDFEL